VDAAKSWAKLLSVSGHDARMAYDGPAAVDVAIEYRPDVVLLDIGLPIMDGYEVAKRIREQPFLQNVILVGISGYGQEADRQRSREAGFAHYLVKPAAFSQVLEILTTIAESAKR
jgi:CheY-like chemotaxis protein